MAYSFTDPARYPYQDGGFFLGHDTENKEIGITTERHLLTIASAGSGKGACLIVPNLRRWAGSAIVVDPKGENATLTAADRVQKGQAVGVLDPYHIAKGEAAGLRCSINPLALIDPESRSVRADLEALGDGMIRRFDPRHAQWDNMAAGLFAGVADFIISTRPPEERTFRNIRDLLLQPDETLLAIASAMAASQTRAGLARATGVNILNKLANVEGIPAGGYNKLLEETGWLDDPAFLSMFEEEKPFDLAAIKEGRGTLYLCIRSDHLESRGGFLRLFVRLGLLTMMSDLVPHGDQSGRCLFLLDEFHSLGKMELIAKAAGLMRGYGVQLWPFLQDIGQLHDLYGHAAMNTFFSNADAQIFFGVNDAMTAQYVSDYLGAVTPEEVGTAPVGGIGLPITGATTGAIAGAMGKGASGRMTGAMVGGAVGLAGAAINAAIQASHQQERAEFEQKAAEIGRPRYSPDAVRRIFGKPEGAAVAPYILAFVKAGDVLAINSAPYFIDFAAAVAKKQEKLAAAKLESDIKTNKAAEWVVYFLIMAGLFGFAAIPYGSPPKEPAEYLFFLFTPLWIIIAIAWAKKIKGKYIPASN